MLRLLSVVVPVAAAWWTWRPLLDAWFYADDFLHLFDLVTLGTWGFLTQIWGGHLYLVRNGIFRGMFELFGPEPRPWFWSMLVTHLVNVVLLHRVIRRLTGGEALACLGAILWGTCPTLEGALGWYSVYGQVLLTTLVLIVVAQLAGTVMGGTTLSVRAALAWGTMLAIGGACFGSGLGIAAAFPVVAVLALPPAQRPARAVGTLAAAGLAILAVYAVARVYAAPHLDPRARVLLSPAALLAELPAAIALTAQLLAFGAYTLALGMVGLRVEHAREMAIGGVVVAVVAVGGWRAADVGLRRIALALGFLTVVAYGTVAFGRTTSLEFLNMPAAHAAAWPRYHYLALALLSALGCTALAAARARSPAAARLVSGVTVAWTVARLVLLVMRPPVLDLHQGARAETGAALARIREAVTATPAGGVAVIENRPFASAAVPWLFPGSAGLFVIYFPDDQVDGRTVRFRASDADWRLAQARGGRIATLVERR